MIELSEVFLLMMDHFLNLRDSVTPYPTGRPFREERCPRHFVPGYDRTVLRDISKQAVARIRNLAFLISKLQVDHGGAPRLEAAQAKLSLLAFFIQPSCILASR